MRYHLCQSVPRGRVPGQCRESAYWSRLGCRRPFGMFLASWDVLGFGDVWGEEACSLHSWVHAKAFFCYLRLCCSSRRDAAICLGSFARHAPADPTFACSDLAAGANGLEKTRNPSALSLQVVLSVRSTPWRASGSLLWFGRTALRLLCLRPLGGGGFQNQSED